MYGYYGGGYAPPYYAGGAMPDQLAQYRSQQQNPPQPQAPPTQSGGNGLIWVQGEAGAKSFLVAPGQTVMLMDSEATVFYIKSTDQSGMPLPLRVFDYSERGTTGVRPMQTVPDQNLFVTRAEFEARIAEILSPRKEQTDGEPSV